MKILYICNEYPPSLHGGIGSFTRDIAESMCNAGHEVFVWGIYAQLLSNTIETINGVKVYREMGRKDGGRLNSIIYRYEFRNKLNGFLDQHTFDIIECQEWNGLLPLGLKHKGFVVRLHGAAIFFDKLLERKGNRLSHWFEKKMIDSAKNIVAVSHYCGIETLKFCNLESKSFQVIYNSVDTERLATFKKDNFTQYKIVFANTVSRKKGVFELVKAFNIIAEKYPYAQLYIIGKLNYTENGVNIKDLLLREVNEKFLDRLFITGWLSSADEVYRQLADAHVCVYPSHMEGFGIAPVEPMAMGKPVLFMNIGPGPEVIENNISGLLINSKSPEDIADKIAMVFEDIDLSNRISNNAYQRVLEYFDKQTIFLKNNQNYYNSLLNDH